MQKVQITISGRQTLVDPDQEMKGKIMKIKTWDQWITGGMAVSFEVKSQAMALENNELRAELSKRDAEIERFNSHIHTCGPTCTKAGCINARLSKEIEQLTETALWQAGRISELLDDAAAQRKLLEQALKTLKVNTTYSEDGRPVYPNDLENHNIITAIQAVLK